MKNLKKISLAMAFSAAALCAPALPAVAQSDPRALEIATARMDRHGERVNAHNQTFEEWLQAFRQKALLSGISRATIDRELSHVDRIDRVIDLDRHQAEKRPGIIAFSTYKEAHVDHLLARGRAAQAENSAELNRASAHYGVPAEIIESICGNESGYGTNSGSYDVISVSATLAWDGRREALFTKYLIDALEILDRGYITRDKMKGSYMGAMGPLQFMSTSVLHRAADGDGDGIKDIWTDKADIFASVANYLAAGNWHPGERWGRAIEIPKHLPPSDINASLSAMPKHGKTLAEWKKLGLKTAGGEALPDSDQKAWLVAPSGQAEEGPYYLLYNNGLSIMQYNQSTRYAIVVGLLADDLAKPPSP